VTPAWVDGDVTVYLGGALPVLRELADESVDALVTDPPAGISFMGRDWDTFPTRHRAGGHVFADGRARPGIAEGQEYRPGMRGPFVAWLTEIMVEARRVMKPGALGLVWAIPRTAGWTQWALEDAGFEIHRNGFVAHLFAQGFPKHKTHLKPAAEVWWLVRKPGRGAGLNIDACRIGTSKRVPGSVSRHVARPDGVYAGNRDGSWGHEVGGAGTGHDPSTGRWPANLVLSHAEGCVPAGTRRVRTVADSGRSPATSGYAGGPRMPGRTYADADGMEAVEAWECVEGCPVAELDRQSGVLTSGFMAAGTEREGLGYRGGLGSRVRNDTIGDVGGASRFFYVAKASTAERSAGLPPGTRNTHPTVKPVALMRWLCRLVTPPGGLLLDCFCGSGSTLVAARLEGFRAIGIDEDPESVETARQRVAWAQCQPTLLEEDAP
jgi:DNA modification methylase